MIQSLLIANRGEIACRVIRTASALGIRTIAVYSDADTNALHVTMADEAWSIGPAPAVESYLRGDAIIQVAKRAGADAIHPGYGFLSENAAFARACAAAGIIFVGPPADAIEAMGSKDAAKRLMGDAGVPIVPGYHGQDQSPETLQDEADRIGYPLLIKAVAGGGGKGMKLVDSANEFTSQLESAQREGKAAFGNDAVLLERYLPTARHVEVQVFADSQGNAVHLFERDCSIQRRHQKVIEEAPAPGLSPEVRAVMGQAAVAAAQAVGYVGAGTVEFIADSNGDISENSFYFMEMNTRLQVEHPVTEAVSGVDLVEWQLRVASGEPLPLQQDKLHLNGHAVEARLYAEDADNEFLPAIGTLRRLNFPAGVRVDTGVIEGDAITTHYDPMIAKVIASGDSRDVAINRLHTALKAIQVSGVTTNLAFLARIVDHAAFRSGDVETRFIDRYGADLLQEKLPPSPEVTALAVIGTMLSRDRSGRDPWDKTDGFRVQGANRDRVELADGDGNHIHVPVTLSASGIMVDLPGGRVLARDCVLDERGLLRAEIDGAQKTAGILAHASGIDVMMDGRTHTIARFDPFAVAGAGAGGKGGLAAPMPGKVTRLFVAEGDQVIEGQELMVLEAMKMEHIIRAPGEGTVQSIHAIAGEQVDEGAVLAVLEA